MQNRRIETKHNRSQPTIEDEYSNCSCHTMVNGLFVTAHNRTQIDEWKWLHHRVESKKRLNQYNSPEKRFAEGMNGEPHKKAHHLETRCDNNCRYPFNCEFHRHTIEAKQQNHRVTATSHREKLHNHSFAFSLSRLFFHIFGNICSEQMRRNCSSN